MQYCEAGANNDYVGWADNVLKSNGDEYVDVMIYFPDKSAARKLKSSDISETLNNREFSAYIFLSETLERNRYPQESLHAHFEQLRTRKPGLTDAEFRRAWRAVCETSIRESVKDARQRQPEIPIAWWLI
jgi:hypothetical protein